MVRTINQSYQEQYQQDKKRKILGKIFLFLILLLGAVGGIVYFLFFSRLFNVREVNVFTKNGEIEVRSVVEKYLAEKKFFIPRSSNIFWVSGDRISVLISQQFASAENIKVEKEYFHGLKISLDQKEAVGVWCYKAEDQCVYFDRHGIAFETATETSGSILLNVTDYKGKFEKLGQAVSSPEMFNLISQANGELKKVKLTATKFIIPAEEDFRFDIQTSEGWKIYLSTKDDLAKQLNSLNLFLAQKITLEKRSQLQYIDLTVPNRVYYK